MVLSFPFLFLFISIFSISLSISPQNLFLVNAQPQPFPSSSLEFVLEDDDDYVYFTTAFIKELENLIRNFEYTFEIEGKYIFPNNTVKQDIVSEYKPAGYDIDNLNYELLGFNITASDIEMHINPIKIDDIKTRVNIPLLLAKNVNVSNGGLINLSYKEVDLGSVYGIYDKTLDRMRVHVPVIVAAKYI